MMLQKNTVEENTFRILKVLQEDENLTGFYLVGGTALALKIGHRRSIDLDLFSPEQFNTQVLVEYLSQKYGFEKAYPDSVSKIILQGFIENVRIDWVLNKYPFVEKPETIEGIRLYSLKDIAAMKLIAIADTGNRLKDFVDIAYLSTIMSFNEMLDAFGKKYNVDLERAILGITYFSDIDFETKIDLIDATYHFEPINERLHDMKRHPDKIYPDFPIKKYSRR
jgi:predicted nucleotidyltransferase component of viral defense system